MGKFADLERAVRENNLVGVTRVLEKNYNKKHIVEVGLIYALQYNNYEALSIMCNYFSNFSKVGFDYRNVLHHMIMQKLIKFEKLDSRIVNNYVSSRLSFEYFDLNPKTIVEVLLNFSEQNILLIFRHNILIGNKDVDLMLRTVTDKDPMLGENLYKNLPNEDLYMTQVSLILHRKFDVNYNFQNFNFKKEVVNVVYYTIFLERNIYTHIEEEIFDFLKEKGYSTDRYYGTLYNKRIKFIESVAEKVHEHSTIPDELISIIKDYY